MTEEYVYARNGDPLYVCDNCGYVKADKYTVADHRFCDCDRPPGGPIPCLRLLTLEDIRERFLTFDF